jgi:hypothetical protein
MKTNYIADNGETTLAWSPMVETTEAAPNKFGWSPRGTTHSEVD